MASATDSSTRDVILDAAERLFAAQGFTPTTIKQIGREAGVNSALLYYSFADKDQLYRQVLQRFVSRLVSRTMSESAAAGDPEASVRAFVGAQAQTLAASPHIPRLLVREMIDFDAAHAVEQIQRLAVTGFRRLCEMIEEGQRAGLFRADLDPRFAAISTIAQLAYFHIARPAIRVLLEERAARQPDEVARAFAGHAAEFAVSALAARGRRRPPRPRSRTA
jgi:AcrR family transcriptional regulator